LRINVKVRPGSAQPAIERNASDLIVSVRERAVDDAANAAVIKAISAWLNIPPTSIKLERGTRSRVKWFQVAIDEAVYWKAFRLL
jgi:uncharacterized protein YggU (UPF0235/DUF167 family)